MIPEINYQSQLFRQTQVLEKEKMFFKVEARIKNVDSNMCFERKQQKSWRLKLVLSDAKGKWFKATAFQKPSLALMNSLTPDEAKKMRMEASTEFGKIMNEVCNAENLYVFGVKASEND